MMRKEELVQTACYSNNQIRILFEMFILYFHLLERKSERERYLPSTG